MNLRRTSVFLLTLFLSPALYGTAISFSNVTGWFSDGIPRTVGYEFVANSTFQVTSLGFIDYNLDGMTETHSVAIWALNGASPLVTGTIPAGTAAPLVGMFRWAPVTPTQLEAGQTYIIVGSYAGSDPWTWYPPCCFGSVGVEGLVTDARISLSGPGYGRAAVFTPDVTVYPSWVGWQSGDSTRSAFIGPNFEFAGSQVPEPGATSLVLLGFGLIAAGLVAVRRKRD